MRAQATDFLHSMRFHADVVGAGGVQFLQKEGQTGAGFSAVTTPEATVESVEYKEGHTIYTKKYPGNPTVSDITMSRGVARRDSSFWDWLRVVIEGSGEYRATLQIKHFHRDTALPRPFPATGDQNATNLNTDRPPVRTSATRRSRFATRLRRILMRQLPRFLSWKSTWLSSTSRSSKAFLLRDPLA